MALIVPGEQDCLPFGIGVTALSLDDAFALIHEQGWSIDRARVQVRRGVRI